MFNKIKIQGKSITSADVLESQYNRIEKSFRLEFLRDKAEIIDIGAQEDDIIGLEFEDAGEWISHIQDIHQIFGDHIDLRSANGLFPSSVSTNEANRGIKNIGVTLLHLIRSKKSLTETAAKKLGEICDHKLMLTPGLFNVDKTGNLKPFKSEGNQDKYLLFIHGTISSFAGSFGDLFINDSSGIAETIRTVYGDRVLAFQHYTLSESPFENLLQLLNLLPKGCKLDVLTHSRGGLIADILAHCDSRIPFKEIYSTDEIINAKNSDPRLGASLEKINKLAVKKEITIENVIRVACPANGTILLGDSLDHFLNGLLAAIGWALGGKSNPAYQSLRALITDIIRARLTPDVLPGLMAMVPESYMQKFINRPGIALKNQLVVIEGDADTGKKFWHSALVVLSNLYYRKANDFVVNTDSMRYGALRESGLYFFLSKDDSTSHFNYFKNENTQQAIVNALSTPVGHTIKLFEYRAAHERTRGVVLDLFKKLKAISYTDISGQKPLVILIPGIMGTHLRVGEKIIWADLGEIGKGRIVKDLSLENKEVDTKYIIGDFYQKIISFLQPTHDIYTFGYDWRMSLSESALKLKSVIKELALLAPNQSIQILAHSMGGLVVRDLMRLHKSSWIEFNSRKNSKTILLGTPWLGSHQIMEVFTGHESRVRQLNFLDTTHTKNELISIFNRYPGLYDLLPINNEKFETLEYWTTINDQLGSHKIMIPPLLDYFKKYKSEILQFNQNAVLSKTYYIAGKNDHTTSAHRIRSTIFGKKIQYLGTANGDGSVTWELGIPRSIGISNIYYAPQTSHGNLANDESLFEGIKDLLLEGETARLTKDRPLDSILRSIVDSPELENLHVMPEEAVSNNPEDAENLLYGYKGNTQHKSGKSEFPIKVNVIHGDLRVASYPIITGHFRQDGITNAEAAVDKYYDYKLSERLKIGTYPQEVGEQLILFDPTKYPKGAVVLGLGAVTDFTAYQLRKTVEAAVLNYTMYFRDNKVYNTNTSKTINSSGQSLPFEDNDSVDYKTCLSCLCIGTGYGKLSMDEALNAILTGVQKANQIIGHLQGLHPIRVVEFIEKYEHIAQHAYYQLLLLEERSKETNLLIHLTKGLVVKSGARRKFQFGTENTWWHNLTTRMSRTEKGILPHLHFTSASGAARVEEQNTFTSQKTVTALLHQLSSRSTWDEQYSKTIFEILIPNPFKEIIRLQNNILWKMDVESAAFPWEMFHDYEYDKTPSFVRAGLIRQLYMENSSRAMRDITRSNSALIIGDPDYSGSDLTQLPQARAEAIEVNRLLQKEGFKTHDLIFAKSHEILRSLYNVSYKILHISGHGTISEDSTQTGVALSDNLFITPAMINNLSRIPEFVFINCCWSGAIVPGKEKWYEQRYQFAANIGTELIRLGVQAVVIAGWPVDDAAAGVFANVLYQQLLQGVTFGDAVKSARQTVWNRYKDSNNTWGAYQCYGDQWYRLVNTSTAAASDKDYFTLEQIHTDLYNLKADTKGIDSEGEEANTVLNNLNGIIQKAKKSGLYSGTVKEYEAAIYAELNRLEEAIDRYEALRKLNKADYSIKSIEQYYNLRVKALVKKFKIGKVQASESLSLELIQLTTEIENLLLMGKTSERLAIIGSAYKRMALIRSNHKFLKDYKLPSTLRFLECSKEYYKQAFEATEHHELPSAIYPFMNWLVIHSIHHSDTDKIKIHGITDSLKNHFKRIETQLKNQVQKHVDYYETNALNNLYQAQLFYTKPAAQLNPISNLLLKNYLETWSLSGTAKNKQSRLDQIEFYELLLKLKERKDSSQQTKRWSNELNKLLQAMKEVLS